MWSREAIREVEDVSGTVEIMVINQIVHLAVVGDGNGSG
jgi:hypothetical protein